jgi:DNA-binding CsgD family transcriptional regulator
MEHLNKLTKLELQILLLTADGKGSTLNKTLGITTRTLIKHRYEIKEKLGAENMAHVMKKAFELGYLK